MPGEDIYSWFSECEALHFSFESRQDQQWIPRLSRRADDSRQGRPLKRSVGRFHDGDKQQCAPHAQGRSRIWVGGLMPAIEPELTGTGRLACHPPRLNHHDFGPCQWNEYQTPNAGLALS